jgi:hypothetical protein
MTMNKKIDLKHNKCLLSLIAVWTISVALLTLCYFAFHLPKREALGQVLRQYKESREQRLLAEKAARQDVRERLERRFTETDQIVRHFSVPQENTTGLVFEIGKIANELNLAEFSSKNQKLKDLSTLKENPEVIEAALRVEFKSSFLKFAQFVNRLERQEPTVFIERVTLRRNEENKREHAVTMELSFMVTKEQDGQNDAVALADVSDDAVDN